MARNLVTLSPWSVLFVPLALGFVVFGSSSCIQIGPDANNGGSNDGADTTTTHTIGDQCTAIFSEFCGRAANPADCDLQQDAQSCQDQWVAGCCGSHCNDTSTVSETSIAACVADLRKTDCANIAVILGDDPEGLPPSCQNVFGSQ